MTASATTRHTRYMEARNITAALKIRLGAPQSAARMAPSLICSVLKLDDLLTLLSNSKRVVVILYSLLSLS